MSKLVGKEEQPEFLQRLLNHCKDLVKGSRDFMSKNYTEWDSRLEVYEAERCPDKQDKAKAKNEEPQKMVVPLTMAQTNTFVAFAMLLFSQRKRFFELEETGAEDQEVRETSELSLEKDLRESKFELILFQFLLDIARMGFGVIKHGWVERKRQIKQVTPVFDELGTQIGNKSEYVAITEFEGNEIYTVSPYRFFPDVRFPLVQFERGEFCACEEEHHRTQLRGMESEGRVSGIEHVTEFQDADCTHRLNSSRFTYIRLDDRKTSQDMICVTEIQVKIIPAEFEIEDGKFLGPETWPVLYLIWYANDQRIIRLEPMDSPHNKFNFECHQFTPDIHRQLNKSLAGSIEKLQEVVDWLINARVSSTVRTLDHQLVVDPSGVDLATVKSRSRIILLKKNAGRQGVDRYIKSLPVQDVTSSNLIDAAEMSRLMDKVTGVNDNATGQYHTGRRSATEAKTVAQGAASRLINVCRLIWVGALAPLGQKMLFNHRALMTEQAFTKLVGPKEVEANPELYSKFVRPLSDLVGGNDFFVFDGTTSGEKAYLAQSYQELLGILLSNPSAAVTLNLDVNKLLQEIYTLRGAPNLKSFALDQAQLQQQMVQQLMAQANGGQPTGPA